MKVTECMYACMRGSHGVVEETLKKKKDRAESDHDDGTDKSEEDKRLTDRWID